MTHEEASEILQSMTKSESLLRHARTVELVMQAYARKLGEDENKWANTGLLHDADYEAHPGSTPMWWCACCVSGARRKLPTPSRRTIPIGAFPMTRYWTEP